MLGRGKQDFSATRMSLTALSQSQFVERSNEEMEQRIHQHKRPLTPAEEEEPEPYRDESSDSQSDSASLDKRPSRRRRLSDPSSPSEESLNSAEAYSVSSDDKGDFDSDGRYSESPEYDDFEGPQDSGDVVEEIRSSDGGAEYEEVDKGCDVAMEVIGSSSDVREEDAFEEEYAEEEEEYTEDDDDLVDDDGDVVEVVRSSSDAAEQADMAQEGDVLMEDDDDVAVEVIPSSSDAREVDQAEESGDEEEPEEDENDEGDEDFDEDGNDASRELNESGIKITDDEEDEREVSEMDIRSISDGEEDGVTEVNNEKLDEETDEDEGDDDSSDVQEISSDEETDVKQDVSEGESKEAPCGTRNRESSSDDIVSDYE